MQGKVGWLVLAAITSAALGIVDAIYGSPTQQKLFYSALTITASYFVFQVLAEVAAQRSIREDKSRYSLRKVTYVVSIGVVAAVLAWIWIEDVQSLAIAYGLIGAGIAVSFQDIFKNLAGGVTLAIGGAYHVGDRIEVDSITGDVVDIGLLYTTLLELRNWVGGDQPTGRLVVVPNGVVLSRNVANFTKDNRFVWDEITIPVTYESDWQMVSDWFRATLEEETQEDSKLASKDLSVLQKKYYLTGRVITPTVFVSFNDNWVNITGRYVVDVTRRRLVKDSVSRRILEWFKKNPQASFGTTTISISKAADTGPQ